MSFNNSVSANNHHIPIVTAVFDSKKELSWSGDTSGQITSFIVDQELVRYTRFPVSKSPVDGLFPLSTGIVSLAGSQLKMLRRGGYVMWKLAFDNSITALAGSIHDDSHVYVGGTEKIMEINLQKNAIVKEAALTTPITKIKKGLFLCCATEKGDVQIQDLQTFKTLATLPVNSGRIEDLDLEGYTMVTCGSSVRDGIVRNDPLVKVFDLRMMKALPSVHYNLGPSFLKIVPTFPSLLYSCTKSGQFQLTDINNSKQSLWDQIVSLGDISAMSLSVAL